MRRRRSLTDRRPQGTVARWPWGFAFVLLVAAILDPLLAAADPEVAGPHPLEAVTLGLTLAGCLGSAAVLLSRRAANPVAWLLPLPAVYLGMGGVAEVIEYVGSDQMLLWARWAGQVSWAATFPPMAIFLPLLFPTGRPLSPRWRWVSWMGGAAVVLLVIGNAVDPDLVEGNPVAIDGSLPDVVLATAGVLLVASLVAAGVSAVVRHRRAHGVERQQLRWFVCAVALVVPAWVVAILLDGGPHQWLGTLMLAVAIGLLPVAVAIAVQRYRLYDIDRVVSRTVAWTALSALLTGAYALVVVASQAVVGGDVPDVVIALATLTAAALFQPLRHRVQVVVDRRFNRARYDAEAIVAAFGQRLRNQFAPEEVRHELLATARDVVAPQHVRAWTPGP